MQKVWVFLERIFNTFLVAVSVVMLTAMTLQIVTRNYIPGLSLYWTEELSIYMVFSCVFVGVITETKNETHIHITLVDTFLAKRTMALEVIKIVRNLVIMFFAIFMCKYGYDILSFVRNQRSPNMGVPIVWLYGLIAFSGLCMTIIMGGKLIMQIKCLLGKGEKKP